MKVNKSFCLEVLVLASENNCGSGGPFKALIHGYCSEHTELSDQALL